MIRAAGAAHQTARAASSTPGCRSEAECQALQCCGRKRAGRRGPARAHAASTAADPAARGCTAAHPRR
eukprot:1433816-Alexandrium_andersonii.AAC.1